MPYQNNAFFLECANSLPAGASPQTSLEILQRFHRHLKLNMTGIEIRSTVADPGGHSPLKRWTFSPRSILITDWQFDEWNWLKKLESVHQQLNRFGLWGYFVPRPLIKFQPSAKLLFTQFQSLKIWILRQCGQEHALERSCLFKMSAPNICTKIFLNHDFISQKKLLPQTPSPVFARALPSVRAPLSIHGCFAPSLLASPSIIGRFAASIRASSSTFNLRNWFDP